MAKKSTPDNTGGRILYRAGFAIFIAGCILNAYDAYVSYTQVSHGVIDNITSGEKFSEMCAFLGLTIILAIECAGITMYKWVQTQTPSN